MCLCKIKYEGGGIAPFWGNANLPEKVSRDTGYRSDSIAISRDTGPLRIPQIALKEQLSEKAPGGGSTLLEFPLRPAGAQPRGAESSVFFCKTVFFALVTPVISVIFAGLRSVRSNPPFMWVACQIVNDSFSPFSSKPPV